MDLHRGSYSLVLLLSGLAAAAWPAAAPAAEGPPPTLEFEAQRIVIGGLTPSGTVAWYSVSREPQGYSTLIVQRSGLTTADAVGEATIDLEREVAAASVWVVVDLDSGAFTAAAPAGTSFRDVGFDEQSVATGPEGTLDRLEHFRPYVELFLARPRVGAWVMAAGDGAAGDEDGEQDGTLLTGLATLEPLDVSPPPPEELQANDVLVMVDPRALEYYAVGFQQ